MKIFFAWSRAFGDCRTVYAECECVLGGVCANQLMSLGTFARVWLVRLASPAEQDKNKVFALKVLRKADGRNI